MLMDILSKLVDADKLGGWVRALVSAVIGIVIAKLPGLSVILTPELQSYLGVTVATLVVGIWQSYVKTPTPTV